MHVGNSTGEPGPPRRPTQADRRARTRTALLESAARGLSRYGYGNLVLEQVAKEAGYTRGALYHQFKDKQDLTRAVLAWVLEAWGEDVGRLVDAETDPVEALLTLARAHAVFCRRDFARVAFAIRIEFSGQDHPIGREIEHGYAVLTARAAALIEAGRDAGTIPPGPPSDVLALGFVGVTEGVTIALAGQAPYDELLVARTVTGLLGLDPHTPHTMEANE